MPLRFTHRILDHLSHQSYEPAAVKAILRDLRVDADDRPAFDAALQSLIDEGRIDIGKDKFVRLPTYGDEVVGKFRLNPKGFGFVRPEHPFRHGDLYVPRGKTRDAISGDCVRARVSAKPWREGSGRSPYVGEIVEVIERGRERFVGVLQKEGKRWMVDPDGRWLSNNVLIRDPHAKNAKLGDKVVIELLHYPEGDYVSEGVIVEVLGEAGKPDVETQAVIEAHGLRTVFPDDAMDQAGEAARSYDEHDDKTYEGREDLTGRFIFTIDPPDARDFDDAISIELDRDAGEWTLGVHIADVATFVTTGSPLDVEASARGNSVYLPRMVIPMLPEVLSNGVCSLQEGVPRLTKSVFITFDGKGRVVSQRLAATVIKSAKRLTYIEAQALIDGDEKLALKHARTDTPYSEQLIETLKRSNQLANILRKRRIRDGMIVLHLPDVDLVFDDEGHVIDAVPEDESFTHTIIEMFMVEANEAVARTFSNLFLPLMRRIHPEPVHGDLEELQLYARAANLNVPERPTRHDLQRLLQATFDSPAGRAVHFAVLRTLSKASYSPAMIGHFALASDHYAHFTSPIRRYPDLLVHRAIEGYLDHTENGRKLPGGKKREALSRKLAGDDRVLNEGELLQLGAHCSDTEVEAAQAERDLTGFLVLQFLHDHHMGDEFAGVITGITGAGVFISIQRFLIEGLIRTEDLPKSSSGERWDHDDVTGRLKARRSGLVISIGDIVTVQIARIDMGARRMDLLLTKFPERMVGATKDSKAKPRSTPKRGAKGKGKGHGKGRRGKRGK